MYTIALWFWRTLDYIISDLIPLEILNTVHLDNFGLLSATWVQVYSHVFLQSGSSEKHGEWDQVCFARPKYVRPEHLTCDSCEVTWDEFSMCESNLKFEYDLDLFGSISNFFILGANCTQLKEFPFLYTFVCTVSTIIFRLIGLPVNIWRDLNRWWYDDVSHLVSSSVLVLIASIALFI